MTTTPTPENAAAPEKKAKPWLDAGVLNGSWAANTNQGRALTCIEFLQAHGFLTESQAGGLRTQVNERAAAAN